MTKQNLLFKSSNIVKLVLFFGLYQYIFKKFIPIIFLDKIVSQLDDIFLILIFSIIVFSLLIKNNNFKIVKTPLNILLPILMLWIIFSFIFNSTPLFNLILTIKNYFLVFILYFFIVYNNKIDSLRIIEDMLRFILFLFSFELLIQLIELIISFSSGNLNDDSLMGGFSGANNLGYALFIPLYFLIYAYLYKIKIYIKYITPILISFFATFAEFAFLLLPFIYIIFNIKKIFNINYIYKISKILLVIAIIFTTISFVNPQRTTGSNSIFKVFSPEFLIYKFTKSEFDVYSGSARMLWFPITWDRLNDNKFASSPLIGMGPGMYASYAAFKTMPMPNESIYNIFGQLEKGLDPNIDSQIIPIWGEFGHIGLVLFITFYFYLFIHFFNNFKKAKLLITKLLNLTASASSLYLLIGMYVNHLLETQTLMLTYVFFIAVASKSYLIERRNIEKTNININTIN